MTNKHKAFADEYLSNGMIGSRAYMSVYKSVKKEETARVNASRLLTNIKIKSYIAAEQGKISDELRILRNELEINKVKLEIKKIDSEILEIDIKNKLLNKLEDDIEDDTIDLIKELIEILGDDLYFLKSDTLGLIKIGRSLNVNKRLTSIKNEICVYDIEILKVINGKGKLESKLHKKFKDLNYRFKTNGKNNTEWFKPTVELLDFINKVN